MTAFEMVEEIELALKIKLDYQEGSDLVLANKVYRGLWVMDCDNELSRKVVSRVHLTNSCQSIYGLAITHSANHCGNY